MLSELKARLKAESCEEYLCRLFERIEKSSLNAFTTLAKESALKEAKLFDKNPGRGLLAGVPIAIKESISTKGIETNCSSRILRGYIPPYDAHVIERLKAEGAIIVGKTNMDEFAMGTSTETSCFGPTKNPWDQVLRSGRLQRRQRGCCGRGRSALLFRLGYGRLSALSGILLRHCGTQAHLRPGLALWPGGLCQLPGADRPAYPYRRGYRSSHGGHIGARRTGFHLGRGRTPQLFAGPERWRFAGLKIGIPKEYFGEGVNRDVEKAVWEAIATLESLGASWQEISLPHTRYALAAYYVIAMSEASSNLARFDGLRYGSRQGEDKDWHTTFSEIRAKGFGPEVKRRIMLGTYALSAGYYGRYYLKALKVRTLIKEDFLRAFKEVDLLASPTMPIPAFKIGERINDPLSLYMADVFTVPINLAGVPAISVPCGFAGRLPVGLQLIGPHFGEAAVLTAAQAFEAATPFHEAKPEVI